MGGLTLDRGDMPGKGKKEEGCIYMMDVISIIANCHGKGYKGGKKVSSIGSAEGKRMVQSSSSEEYITRPNIPER